MIAVTEVDALVSEVLEAKAEMFRLEEEGMDDIAFRGTKSWQATWDAFEQAEADYRCAVVKLGVYGMEEPS